MGENPSALAQSVVWTDRTASKTAPCVSLLQQALAVGTKGGRHACGVPSPGLRRRGALRGAAVPCVSG